MKCVRCQNQSATVKLTRIVKGKVIELSLCQSCAAEVSPYQKKLATAQGLNALIAHLFKAEQSAAKKEEESSDASAHEGLICPSCRLAFPTYKRTLMLGCEHCYANFGDPLLTDLRKIHGAVRHRHVASDAPPTPVPADSAPASPEPTGETEPTEEAKTAPPPTPEPLSVERLRSLLQEAIEAEDFERAAELRDRLRSLSSEE